MPKWLANLAAMWATLGPLLVGVYWIGDHTGWRPEWHWEAEHRAWFDKADFLFYRIQEDRNAGKGDDPRLVGIYCGLSQAIKKDIDPSIKC